MLFIIYSVTSNNLFQPITKTIFMRSVAIILFILIPCLIQAQNRPDNTVVIGKIDSVYSSSLKEKRYCLVYTPPSYTNNLFPSRKYPVLYLLDGDAHFHSVTGLIQFLSTGINGNYVIPEMIVVAIPNTDRTRDLTPTNTLKGPDGKEVAFLKTSGGNANFFSFLKKELIPHIDSAYRTNSYRTLIGHSLGGITAINALYAIPETFNAYVSIDPSLWYDNQLLLNKAKDYFGKSNLKNKFLFVGQANTVQADDTSRNLHFESIIRFNSIMENYNTSGINYQYKYYPNDDHGSAPMITEYDALRFIFDGYKMQLFNPMLTVANVKTHFANFSAKMGTSFLPPEDMINTLGYGFLNSFNDTTKALEFFQLNIDLYPFSANVWDSMAETLMYKGDTKKAILYYEKSLALNPDNSNARDMIKKMKSSIGSPTK